MDKSLAFKDSLTASLEKLRKDKRLTDVTLLLPDESTQHCHKLILIAASPYFDKLFNDETLQQVKVDFSNADTIRAIIDYLYTGEIKIDADTI